MKGCRASLRESVSAYGKDRPAAGAVQQLCRFSFSFSAVLTSQDGQRSPNVLYPASPWTEGEREESVRCHVSADPEADREACITPDPVSRIYALSRAPASASRAALDAQYLAC